MSGLLTYRRTIQPGRSESIGARGVAIIVRDVIGSVTITARSSKVGAGSGQAYSNEMRKFEKWFLPTEFDSVEVGNNQAEPVTVELLVGYGDFVREITSRSQASKFLRGIALPLTLTDDTETFTLLAQENLQRKRLLISCVSAAAATKLAITPEPVVVAGVAMTDENTSEWGNTDVVALLGPKSATVHMPGENIYYRRFRLVFRMAGVDYEMQFARDDGANQRYELKIRRQDGGAVGDIEAAGFTEFTTEFPSGGDGAGGVQTVDLSAADSTDFSDPNERIWRWLFSSLPSSREYFDSPDDTGTVTLPFPADSAAGYGPALKLDGTTFEVETTAAVYVRATVATESEAELTVEALEEEYDA